MGELVPLATPAPPVSVPVWRAELERLRGAYADRTIDEAARAFRVFQRWCQAQDIDALPAAPTTLARYLDDKFESFAVRTVRAYLYHIRRVHEVLGHPDPTRAEAVRLAFRRDLRLKGFRARQALGLSAALRDRLIAACDDTSLIGLRDRALIAVGYDTLCRRAELVPLRLEHLTRLPDGAAKVLIPELKNDPLREGRIAYISRRGLQHAEAWLAAAKIHDGPLFRPVFKTRVGDARLHAPLVNRRLKLAAERAGLGPEVVARLSGHSFRVGAAQDLAIAGRSLVQIMRAGRWRDPRVVADYVRAADVNVWADEAPPAPQERLAYL